jgi:hypothetical protein
LLNLLVERIALGDDLIDDAEGSGILGRQEIVAVEGLFYRGVVLAGVADIDLAPTSAAKDTWLGPEQVLGGIGALYNLTMDPYEKYDMTFNCAVSFRRSTPFRRKGRWNVMILSVVRIVMEETSNLVQ